MLHENAEFWGNISRVNLFDWPKSIAVAMVTGQSGKVAAEISPKTA
jgi:hypothetical protein